MLSPCITFHSGLESSSAPDLLDGVVEFEAPADAGERGFELLRGPWSPMFGDTPLYDPAV
jgi:hypothetical protein